MMPEMRDDPGNPGSPPDLQEELRRARVALARLRYERDAAIAALRRGPAALARERVAGPTSWHAFERFDDYLTTTVGENRWYEVIFMRDWKWHPAGDVADSPPAGGEGGPHD